MRLPKTVLLTSGLLFLLLAAAAQTAAHDISSVAWIAGSWRLTQGDTVTEEQWMSPAGGSMLGMNRVTGRGKTLFFEFLRIESRPDGLYFIAQPKGRPPVEFKAAEITATQVIFSNPQHDFPKRIIYRKNPDGSLTARVEGDPESNEKPEEFRFQPVP